MIVLGGKVKDLKGERFGRLIAKKRIVKEVGKSKQRHSFWYCDCDCGEETLVRTCHLTSGNTKSCGCLNNEINKERVTTHGMSGTRFYNIWHHMKKRMLNKDHRAYKWYGGKGIKLHGKWEEFEGFYDDMYSSYKRHVEKYGEHETTIDRINNNKGYFPENCRWATREEQAENINRNAKKHKVNGEWLTIREISDKYDIKIPALRARLLRGWPDERLADPLVWEG